MENILIIDKFEFSKPLQEILRINNFNVEICDNFEDALEIFNKNNFSIILTELELDNIRAYDFIKKVRIISKIISIIIQSNIKNQDSIIYAFEIGADDYIIKPYSEFELLSRIRAHIRKINAIKEILNKSSKTDYFDKNYIIIGSSIIYFDKMIVKNENFEVPLTYKELNLINLLYENRNKPVSRDLILKKIWGYNKYITDRVIDTTIAGIRKKINDTGKSPKYIKTLKGIGYKLEID